MRILVTGASGQLGPYVIDELLRRGHDVVAWSGTSTGRVGGIELRPVALDDDAAVSAAFDDARPDAVIHAAARARPAEAQQQPEHATRINDQATRRLAGFAAERSARFVYLSTDLVFDGAHAPYAESAEPRPLSEYGRSKLAPETAVRGSGGVVLRVALMFGPSRATSGAPNFFDQQVAALREGTRLKLFHDEYRTPLALWAAAAALAELCVTDATKARGELFHLGGPERMNRVAFAERLAAHLGLEARYDAISRLDIDAPEPRPADVALDSAKFYGAFPNAPRPTLEDALMRMGVAPVASD